MRKRLPMIIALILLFVLGTVAFGCARSGTTTSDQEQTDTIEDENGTEENGTEENENDGTETEEEEAAVPAEYTPGDGPRVVMETSQGNLLIELYPDVAPITVEKITGLINDEFYNGLTFHRYVPGFVVQGGDPDGNGTGGPGFKIPAEFNDGERPHIRGALAMARSADPDSAGSQFYFVLDRAQAAQLDGQYTVFGQIIEGIDVMDKLRQGDVMNKVYMQESQDN